MSRPTVGIVSPKGEASTETIAVPNVFKVSHHKPRNCEAAARAASLRIRMDIFANDFAEPCET